MEIVKKKICLNYSSEYVKLEPLIEEILNFNT